ncbi:uncharacterized protein LOC103717790 [Phoenix dactylifera]|uniref:Uncharacterized protein LOC103717790 n=1 Tax=Phoenix dactylifera TaxID=42345 RepID=A0A8B7CQZ2_PHODC|nr:uncharacterized protein LOC103717790 [Phoenix dactylifera]
MEEKKTAKNNMRERGIISSSSESEVEEDEVAVTEEPPPTWEKARGVAGVGGRKRLLTKQLSMRETTREAKWEKRRRQILHRRQMVDGESSPINCGGGRLSRLGSRVRSLTDEDWDELMGSIELGFGFNEEDGGHDLCDTLPALDLYFAVNRQLSDPRLRSSPSPASTPTAATSSASTVCGSLSPSSPLEPHQHSHSSPSESWKICNPGDNPQHVKTRLRHWAQAVACSVRQSSS